MWDSATLEEINVKDVSVVVEKVEPLRWSLVKCKQFLNNSHANRVEGLVLVDSSLRRMKMKSDSYKKSFFVRSVGISEERILEYYLTDSGKEWVNFGECV